MNTKDTLEIGGLRAASPAEFAFPAIPELITGQTIDCPACGGAELESFYQINDVPAHSCLMLPTKDAALAFPRGDIELAFCRDCGFMTNLRFDPKLNSYSPQYEETQSFSPRFMRFVNDICDDQIAKYGIGPGTTVLEIGCGKGEFLVALCERAGCNGIGIDPGYRPERTRSSAANRIRFIRDFYGPPYSHLQADYVCCRHTLEHIGPVREFMTLVRQTIGDRRHVNVFFELPDMERVLEQGVFWDIYYEHCTYFTRGSLARVFRETGFDVVELYKAYGGQYLMLEARPAPGPTAPRLRQENDLERTAQLVDKFRSRLAERLGEIGAVVESARKDGRTVAIWGSGSKCVSLISSLRMGPELTAVVDINPHKHGKFLAGSGLEIVGPDALKGLRPDVILLMNSIYTEEVRNELNSRGLKPQLIPL
jgi:SAM-dependent methyltransferase